MRLTRTDIWKKFTRNIEAVGTTDTDITNEFNYQLGVTYQLFLAKLKNYKTYLSSPFTVGMNVQDITTGAQAVAISTVTSNGTTVTVTTSAAHGINNSDTVVINNVVPSGIYTPLPSPFNGSFTATVLNATQFTYTLASSQNGVAGTHAQYYPYPPGFVDQDGIIITVGGVKFPLKIISSEALWEQLNAIQVQASALPQFCYPGRDSFGIWPIPQSVYTGNIFYHYRDRNLMVDDYAIGTVAVTQNSPKVVVTTGIVATWMIGMWFTIDDTTVPGSRYFYRIVNVNVSANTLQLSQNWQGSTISGVSLYRIGETPELPEDLHQYLPDGATGGFYKDFRHDSPASVPYFNNMWTGDPANATREIGDTRVAAGLIGAINAYDDRDDDPIVDRNPSLSPLQMRVWATSINPG